MATWTATTPYASKKQLVSSISGLYNDLQDLSGFDFQNLEVSTLTVKNWISAPTMYVSDIRGAHLDISGILYSDLISTQIANFQFTAVSSIQFVVNPSFSVSFNAKDAIFGALSGLGFMIFETLLGAGAGTGLALKGLGEGIAAMITARGTNNTFINNTTFELLAGSTQLQISTLGNAYPLYSSITRYVSSVSGNQIPGSEIFVSTFINPGATCIRSISDPYPIPSSNANIATSTIQAFGQWVEIPGLTGSNFLGITLSNDTDSPLLNQERYIQTINNQPMMNSLQWAISSNNFNFPVNTTPYPNYNNVSKIFYNRDEYQLTNNYISSPYIRFQSTFTNVPDPFFIRSTLSAPLELVYTNNVVDGDFAFCEPDESGFRSTMVVDLIVNGSKDLFIQWGLAVDNLNSTIKAGTAKRVSWDIPASYSNFIDIPQAVSTLTSETTQQILDIKSNPYEIQFNTFGTGMQPTQIAWNVNGMTFGSNTSLSNTNGYPYQFTSSLYVNGAIEANTIIAISSIFATSTFVDTQISTASIIADLAEITDLYNQRGYFSTLYPGGNITNQYINSMGMHRFMGFQTPISIVSGKPTNLYDTTSRFDFVNDQFPQAFYIIARPNNNTLAYFFSTNIEIPNLTVENLTANNIVYSNADVPNLQTSTIAFGWTGSFAVPTPPQFSLQQSLTTEPGVVWNNYQAASNQVLNMMAFSNSVNVLAQQFSTPLSVLNTTFDATNIQGWASTIFTNASFAPFARVNLEANAGNGELSLQGQADPIVVSLNTNPGGVGGVPVTVPVGSTYKFTSASGSWTTAMTPPAVGTVQYNNNFNMYMDFENLYFSTTDTLCLNAETIKLNGQVVMPNAQFSNLYVNDFVSTSQVDIFRSYTGSLTNEGVANPLNINNIVNSTDFTTIYDTVNPNRGFNAFNSYNVGEWNNNVYNIDTNASSGRPIMILGDLIEKVPSFSPYSGQFFINNAIDSPGQNIPLYVNREGLLSTIGFAPTNQYSRVFTNDGSLWNIQCNVPTPQGAGGYTYSNYMNTTMTSRLTQVTHGKPLLEETPTRYMKTNKIIFDCPQIRCYTMASPSFTSKESGFELSSYFDANVVFGQGSSSTDSDAVNPIVNSYGNYYYSVAGWSAQIWFSRIRTNTLGIQGFDIDPIVGLISGTAGDFIWFSARYLNVNGASPEANIRETYFMTPKNYHTSFGWLGQM